MIGPARLRSAAALAHLVPGARLRLRGGEGAEIVVDRTPDADLDPCAFRQVVLHTCRAGSDRAHPVVDDVVVGGTLADVGGGLVVSRVRGEGSLHWLAVTAPAAALRAGLADCPFDGPDVEIEAVLRPDPELGVTVVRLTTSGSTEAAFGDRVARWVQGVGLAVEVEEFLRRVGADVD